MQIYYLSTKHNRLTIDRYLSLWGEIHFWDILPISYESLVTKKNFPQGLYIFSDLELLHNPLRQQVINVYHQISQQGFPTLNHPESSMTRLPLLKTLFQQGGHSFNVFRATEDFSTVKYPVFLRKIHEHTGPKTELLATEKDLNQVILRLQSKQENLHEWMITEFCDTSDLDGVFRKYSSFLVGNTLIPRHLFFSRSWIQKTASITDQPAYLQEEREYLEGPRFDDQLRQIFQLANITYGRIDFGVRNGQVQTWEINTNPSILTHQHILENPRLPIHQTFFRTFSTALQTFIDSPLPSPPLWKYLPDRASSAVHWFYQKGRHHKMTTSFKKTIRSVFGDSSSSSTHREL